ncbi:ADP-ribosylglycohydrolase family protein [Cytophagaceae bacterium DM2B3-1]|uniref:ADP-ribosylglycohydrolase family protein n=1 Tax=Xanthocytophaga flava TaxID=3048013 RepID=A0ABT7CF42_9BACT|nr:ADP-ribosylglycohydrolase family protein [Xanthocytophaga flavus]MDJ1492362.1 ADP-ribosylglycohydrolase family protein [Xanthocytophaga flavus]
MKPINFQDILLGVAIGDAFGAGIEFMDRDWIRNNVDFTRFVNARFRIPAPANEPDIFTRNYTAWDYTDDTEMTLGVIHALLSHKEFTQDLLITYWTNEYLKGVKQKGYGRNGHGSMRWVYSGEKTIREVRDFQRNTNYPGNAPVMRAIPFGLVPENKIDSYAIINANTTHPHPKARVASILIARATYYLLVKQGNPAELIFYCQEHVKGLDTETDVLLQNINNLPGPEQLLEEQYQILCGPQPIQPPRFLPGIKGVPSDAMLTVGCILYILKHINDTFAGLRFAINLGGDVDSVASVCTGILAGRYGLSSLPEFMIANVEGKIMIESLAGEWEAYFER